MKVFFGVALDDMIRELRGQGVATVRLHVLPEVQGRVLVMRTHVTTLCNNQVYESTLQATASLDSVASGGQEEFIRTACEQERKKVAERLAGFEVRRGIFQE
jgi:hypothetical protein